MKEEGIVGGRDGITRRCVPGGGGGDGRWTDEFTITEREHGVRRACHVRANRGGAQYAPVSR